MQTTRDNEIPCNYQSGTDQKVRYSILERTIQVRQWVKAINIKSSLKFDIIAHTQQWNLSAEVLLRWTWASVLKNPNRSTTLKEICMSLPSPVSADLSPQTCPAGRCCPLDGWHGAAAGMAGLPAAHTDLQRRKKEPVSTTRGNNHWHMRIPPGWWYTADVFFF